MVGNRLQDSTALILPREIRRRTRADTTGRVLGVGVGVLCRLAGAARAVVASARDRRALEGMSDRSLRDMGIDRASIESHDTAWFWRLR